MTDMPINALVVLAEGFEEIEAIATIDILRRAEMVVTTASISSTKQLAGRNGVIVQTDALLADHLQTDFDVVVLPGGPGVVHLRSDPRVIDLAKRQAASGRLLAAICAAPTVLHDAGLLENRRYTAHFSVAKELTQIIEDEPVVEDGNLITSRGAGTAVAFGLAIVARLRGESTAQAIADSICLFS